MRKKHKNAKAAGCISTSTCNDVDTLEYFEGLRKEDSSSFFNVKHVFLYRLDENVLKPIQIYDCCNSEQ